MQSVVLQMYERVPLEGRELLELEVRVCACVCLCSWWFFECGYV